MSSLPIGRSLIAMKSWSSEKKFLVCQVILFLLALTARLAYVVVQPQGLSFDEPYYDDIAVQLVSGHGFTFPYSAWFTSIPNQPTSVQEPLYPIFLAFLKILLESDNYLGERIVQSVFGSLIPILVAIWGRRIFGWRNGILAGGILAFYPPLIYFNRYLMTETLYTLFLVTAFSLTSVQSQSIKWVNLLAGIIFGLACLTRNILLGFAPVFLLWIWLTRAPLKKSAIYALLVALGMVIAIGPWTLRNIVVHKAFVPISTKGGWNLYFYSYPVTNYNFNDRWDDINVPNMAALTEFQREREFIRLALGFIREKPALQASFALSKLVDFWNPVLEGGNKSLSLLNVMSFGILTVLAFGALIKRILQRRLDPLIILAWLLIFFYMVQAMIFTGGGKARLPIEPLIVLLGSEVLWAWGVRLYSRFQKAVA